MVIYLYLVYEGLKNPPTSSLTNDSYINASKSLTVKKLSFSDDNNTSLNGTFKYKNIGKCFKIINLCIEFINLGGLNGRYR